MFKRMKKRKMIGKLMVVLLLFSLVLNQFGLNNSFADDKGDTIDITVTKKWEPAWAVDLIRQYSDANFANSCTIKLIANDEDTGESITLNDSNAWQGQFENVAKFDDNGEPITYSVEELESHSCYTSDVSGSAEAGFVVTNYISESCYMVDSPLSIYKVWKDNNNEDGIRPDSITLHITYSPGADHVFGDDPLVLNAGNGWGHTKWITEQIGTPIGNPFQSITIEEEPVEGYKTEIAYDLPNGSLPELGSLTHVTNVRVIDIEGQKTWNDNDDQDGKRPESITIRLMNGTKQVASKEVTADDGWSWTFTDLPKYDNGNAIDYTIKEDAVADYSTKIDGYDVTNTYPPETIEVKGSKIWEDNNNQDGKRPESITIRLMNGDTEVAFKEVTEVDGWSWTFTDLPKYADGTEIVYTLEEVSIEGYNTAITGDAANGFVVTNTHTPDMTEVKGSKIWEDNNNQDGKRPESITIRLMNGDTEVASKEVTEEDGWSWTFTDLPKYANGEEVAYTIKEDAVAGYSAMVDGYNVSNTYTPEKTSVPVKKVWVGKELDKAIVKLLADGTEKDSTVLNATNNWQHTFSNLDKYKDGKAIVYTVTEAAIVGYTSTIEGDASKGFTVTNIKDKDESETVLLSVEKKWLGLPTGTTPPSITLQLYRDGVAVTGSAIELVYPLTSHTWQGLPKANKDGKDYVYTADEVAVPTGFTKVVRTATNGAIIITNTYDKPDDGGNGGNPGSGYTSSGSSEPSDPKLYKLGNYVWYDDNHDGVQDPTEHGVAGIKVVLFDKDGNQIAETVTDINGRYIFTGLANGEYSVQFSNLPAGYQVTLSDVGVDTLDSDGLNPSGSINNADNLTLDLGIYKPAEPVVTPVEPAEPQLPQTNENLPVLPIALGLLLIVAGAGAYVWGKRTESEF